MGSVEQPVSMPMQAERRFRRREWSRNRTYYYLIIPVVIYFILIRYMPLYFLQVAFREFRVTRPISQTDWVGFRHFTDLFRTPMFGNALWNTIRISFAKLLFGFPAPIILALLLNEIRSSGFKRFTQSVLYLPHFISWVVIAGIMYNLLSPDLGIINNVIRSMGGEAVYFMGEDRWYVPLLVSSSIWKESGWGTIIYLATISRIDPDLYESAMLDGANRFQRMIRITLPLISDVIVVLLILRLGNVLTVGFEQIMAIGNPGSLPGRHVLDTFTYAVGLRNGRYGIATAAGLFKSLVAGLMIYTSDRFAKSLGQRGLI